MKKELHSNSADVCRQIVALIAAGIPAPQAREILDSEITKMNANDFAQFESVWSLAIELGGPPAVALGRLANVFDLQQKREQEVALAYAAPKATARLVMGLPVFAVLLAQLLGMNPLGAITNSPLGFISVALGCGLLVAGRYWSNRMLASALPEAADPGAHLDSVVIGLQAGLPLETARQHTASTASESDKNFLDEAAELSRKTGAALTEILLSNADRFRQNLNFEIAERISKLSIRLMIPLGVAVLPAFVLLSIVPISISLLSDRQL